MSKYIVTVKLPKNPNYDPRNKVTGFCPASLEAVFCSDITGEHHSILVNSPAELAPIRERFVHVTRVEQVD